MKKYKMIAVVLVLKLLPCYLTFSFASETGDWNFTGKNQPHAEDLAEFDASHFELTCADRRDVMYENYARLHPAFRQYLADTQMRKKWRIAMITGTKPNRDSFNNCFYSKLRKQWGNAIYTTLKHSLIFCGKSFEYLDEQDKNAADALAEMTQFAVIGRPQAILTLLSAVKNSNRVRLNIDITYYLQRHLQFFLDEQPPVLEAMARRYRQFIKPEAYTDIDPDRKKFLDTAFANGDHLKVLEMTAPCQGT